MPNADGSSDRNLIQLDCSKGEFQDFSGAILAPPDDTYTGIFKYSGAQRGPLRVEAGQVTGAKETVLDVNNQASNLDISAKLWDATPCKYAFSIKGGAHNITIGGLIHGHSKECEVFFGNWSDQNHDPSSGLLKLVMDDGSEVRVRYFDDDVKFAPNTGPYKVLFPWAWLPCRGMIRRIFNELRRHPFTAKLFGLT